jgi:hypothetical protein
MQHVIIYTVHIFSYYVSTFSIIVRVRVRVAKVPVVYVIKLGTGVLGEILLEYGISGNWNTEFGFTN